MSSNTGVELHRMYGQYEVLDKRDESPHPFCNQVTRLKYVTKKRQQKVSLELFG